ncbi:MAG: SoxR reducing system RseC family protein [Spirochaetes bacterium]|nr:SoxR reducing system RseC family protein [Spirochaetota bacterium]
METECGIVTQVKDNYVLVEADAVSFCSSCSNHGCTMRQSKGRQLWIENTLGASSGDRVIFELPSKGIVLSSVVLYGIPIVFLIAGIVLGIVVPLPMPVDRDILGIVTGMLFLAISFVIMRVASKYIVRRKQFAPTMVKVEKLL